MVDAVLALGDVDVAPVAVAPGGRGGQRVPQRVCAERVVDIPSAASRRTVALGETEFSLVATNGVLAHRE